MTSSSYGSHCKHGNNAPYNMPYEINPLRYRFLGTAAMAIATDRIRIIGQTRRDSGRDLERSNFRTVPVRLKKLRRMFIFNVICKLGAVGTNADPCRSETVRSASPTDEHAAEHQSRNSLTNTTDMSEETQSDTQLAKALYTAKVHTTGGRDGAARSTDGRLDIKLSSPGSVGTGTNPEQLFAAGWSACFEGAMGLAARKMKGVLPVDLAIDAEVDLCQSQGAYFLQARLNVSLPGVEREVAQALVDAAHQTCPYSKATRGNIDVVINLV